MELFEALVETSSEPGPCLSADYLSLSPGSCGVLVISAGPAHPAPGSQPPAGTCNGEPPGKLKYFLRWKYFQPFFGHQCYISVSFLEFKLLITHCQEFL